MMTTTDPVYRHDDHYWPSISSRWPLLTQYIVTVITNDPVYWRGAWTCMQTACVWDVCMHVRTTFPVERRQSEGKGGGARKGGLEEEANTKGRRCTKYNLLLFLLMLPEYRRRKVCHRTLAYCSLFVRYILQKLSVYPYLNQNSII